MSKFRLNWDIVEQNMDAETAEVVGRTKVNVDAAVDKVVEDFVGAVAEKLDKFTNDSTGVITAFDADIAEARKELDDTVTSLRAQLQAIRDAAGAVQGSIENSDEMQKQINALNTATGTLKGELDGFQEKVTKFGSTAGKFIAGRVRTTLIGI
ncbi:hypothetical protein [Kordiimonas laminariae]|uniref:hypothetical protein n=1 Tax=Kordiimonas laminariae TaxID=2917717 RepID=UPI001FF2BFEA|nr:hypothetical protein [Kordiimonas laminariae]MCK0068533.1 hypothetical protein [Kordiimonas laminariae]